MGDRARNLIAYACDADFQRVLKRQMEVCNDPTSSMGKDNNKIAQINEKMAEVKGVMYTNIDKVLERGERIELLVDKSDNLNTQSFKFKKRAKKLKNQMLWQYVKTTMLLVLIVGLVIYFILAAACGFDLKGC